MAFDWVFGIFIVVAAAGAGCLGTVAIIVVERRSKALPISIFADVTGATVFLFDGETLIDTTPSAKALLLASPILGGPWLKVLAYMAVLFPEFELQLARLPAEGSLTLASVPDQGAPMILQAEVRGGLTRLSLVDPDSDAQAQGQDLMAVRAMNDELEFLRTAVAHVPVLIWRERLDGDVIWANSAYLLRVGDIGGTGQDLTWPLPRLFERVASSQNLIGQRQKLALNGGRVAWYDLAVTGEGDARLFFALPADVAVQAETGLRDFMQTLTKTFAHLHVGLAIFDQQRQLQLFNPALLDLTGLPVDFLSMRPSLLSVLDAMRDRNMIPEPKDYRGWRRQLVELEKAAASGLYEETWSLPGGQTYRVIGRPHPNGAIALMIEDISGETLRTRRYRADLELGQSVIDHVDEAIAVFSEAGQLVMSNAAYAPIWGNDPSVSLDDASLRNLCAQWRRQSAPSTVWNDLEDFAANQGDRAAWRAEARLLDGRLIDCRFAPLSGGATLTGFCIRDVGGTSKEVVAEGGGLKRA
ncbi:MAG: PAS-domain containing protein [bacterium]